MRRHHRVGPWVAAGVVVVVGVLLASGWPFSIGSGDRAVAWPGWGFTHTQKSVEDGASKAVESVRRTLAAQPLVQDQAIMGWGTDNPEPSPGHYDFAGLDERVQFIRDSGGIPVITLCCAPDWMKGGRDGETNWSRLAVAPSPEHYGDFAALAATIARRYPDVDHFMVWNELKGFWDEERNTWDAEGYTDFYNQVYEAVKEANPRARIGGPYISMANDRGEDAPPSSSAEEGEAPVRPPQGSWGSIDPRALTALTYWLRHKVGADFVVVDGHARATGGSTDPFTALEKFAAVNDWLHRQTNLPIWWAEWYVDQSVTSWPAEQQLAVYTAAMIQFARSGTDTALYWNPPPGDRTCTSCLWTDTAWPDGGRPLPLLTDVLQRFARWFPPGTRSSTVTAPPGVLVLAQPEAVVAVNTTGSALTFPLDGGTLTLSPYQTQWLTSP